MLYDSVEVWVIKGNKAFDMQDISQKAYNMIIVKFNSVPISEDKIETTIEILYDRKTQTYYNLEGVKKELDEGRGRRNRFHPELMVWLPKNIQFYTGEEIMEHIMNKVDESFSPSIEERREIRSYLEIEFLSI